MKLLLCISCLLLAQFAFSQNWQVYEPSEQHPYGQANPIAPAQLADFQPMIGTCDCKSLMRRQDGTWPDTVDMVWSFKYALNGTAIQDQTWSEKLYATSMRQFHPDSSMWVVNYRSWPGVSTVGGLWKGKKVGADIVLKQAQKAPNGMQGVSRLSFVNIREEGFDWRGEWVNEEQGIVYPFWLIWCKKRRE